MGQAKRRGSFEQRKAEAIKAGRIPEVRRRERAEARAAKNELRQASMDFLKLLYSQKFN